MEENKETSRHDQLKYRLRNRIDKDSFEHMPQEIQDYLLELDPADVKEKILRYIACQKHLGKSYGSVLLLVGSPVLLDRMDIVELPSYTSVDKEKIVTRYVWPRLLKEYRLDCLDYLCDPFEENFEHPESLRLEDDAVNELIRQCPEEGVRDLERICRLLCESVISIYYADGELINSITANNLPRLLGPIYYKK